MGLTETEITAYRKHGYLSGLPIFSAEEMQQFNQELPNILSLLKPDETTKDIREWHEKSAFLFEICMHERILDHVESLIGPDFYMWASNFFIKPAGSSETVAWHQDAYYWPLRPIESATVWLAFDDVDEDNGAMQVLPGSHKGGMVEHNRDKGASDSVLSLVADTTGFDLDTVVSVPLSQGQISIHDDKLLHWSPGNASTRRRAGFTIRYSPNRVQCDLSINPHFRIYPARGKICTTNPHGEIPETRYGRLLRDHKSIEESGAENEKTFWETK